MREPLPTILETRDYNNNNNNNRQNKVDDIEYIETVALATVTNKENDFIMRWKTLATLLSLQKCFCLGLWCPLCKLRL